MKVKTAVLGAGQMGRRHIQVVRALGLDLVGVADPNPTALAAVQRDLQLPPDRLFQDPGKLLESRPECVIVASTAPSHCELSCLAAERGAGYILCEKPLAVSLAECDRMMAAAERHRTQLAVNHQMRFMPTYCEAKKTVDSEEFGGLSSLTVTAGNIGLAMNGSHLFELFRFLTDEAPAEVMAWFSEKELPNPRGSQFHDPAGQVRLTTAGGKRFYLEAGHEQGHGILLVFAGPNGLLTINVLEGVMRTSLRRSHDRSLATTRYATRPLLASRKLPPPDAVADTRAVLEALLSGQDVPTAAQGRNCIQTLVAAYISQESGHIPVRFDDPKLPRERKFAWP